MKNFHIFIGYDEREHEVFKVAEHTIKKHTKSINVVVHKLHHKELREQGLFTRRWMTQRNGQMVCLEDNKPFSTQFSHSRFLVPELWRRLKDTNKDDFVMFVDCDFVFKEDLGVLLHEIKSSNQNAPVYAVKHNYKPTSETKMDNVEQSQYNGKLWSAMVVYDMSHKANESLIPRVVNSVTGRYLHTFGWLDSLEMVGEIDEKWHFVPNHSEPRVNKPCAIHFTEGGPWFENYRNCRYAEEWLYPFNESLSEAGRITYYHTDSIL